MHGERSKASPTAIWQEAAPLSSLAMPNSIVRELSYEQRRDLITGMNYHLGETVLVSRTQGYDALGRPATRTQQRGTEAARSDSFSYNGRNELTAATLGAAPYGYSYDNIGNRKTAREPAGELAYAANGLNQYTGIEESGEAPFVPTYDASGNQTLIKTSTGVWTVVYNAANRAVSFTSRDGATVVECGYDYQGRRYMKKVTQNGTVASHERYLYRGYLQIAALDMLDNRNVLRTLLWDPLEPVLPAPGPRAGRFPVLLRRGLQQECHRGLRRTGNDRGGLRLLPYGAVTGTGSLVQPVQWSGEMHDEEPALAYYNYRYYNPKDGIWINRDPIAEQGGWNLYAFVRNNAIDKRDRNGLGFDLPIPHPEFPTSTSNSGIVWPNGEYTPPGIPPSAPLTPDDLASEFCRYSIPAPKCTCQNSSKVLDPYPDKARSICIDFLKKYQFSIAVISTALLPGKC